MVVPQNAFLALAWLLSTTLTCASLGHAFVPPSADSPSDHDPLPLSLLARQVQPRIAVLRERLERQPDQAEVLVELGEELEKIGDLRRAVAVYDRALRARPGHPLAYYGFWHARLDLRARETRAVSPESPESPGSPGSEDIAPTPPADDPGRFEAGAEGGRAWTPGEAFEARTRLSRALLGEAEVDAALEQYRAALANHPIHEGVRLQLARALMLSRRWEEARTLLEQVVRLRPDLAGAQYALGLVRYTLNDLPGSIEAYRDALRADPSWPRARFQLGLCLRLTGRADEGFVHLLEAARQGLPRAQYLVGAAYWSGHGVPADAEQAVTWWFRAAGQGLPEAREGLARLRLAALGGPRSGSLEAAFRSYRDSLWAIHPELARAPELTRASPEDSVGVRLLQLGRTEEALATLIHEASALSPLAHRVLQTLYEVGLEGALEPYDGRIRAFFEETAAEGFPRSRLVLGRLYAEGLGVTADSRRARRLLAPRWSAGVARPTAWPPQSR